MSPAQPAMLQAQPTLYCEGVYDAAAWHLSLFPDLHSGKWTFPTFFRDQVGKKKVGIWSGPSREKAVGIRSGPRRESGFLRVLYTP
jgi:hypothetical protein